MSQDDKQATAVDLMAQNIVTHLMNKLEEKGVLTKEDVQAICSRSEQDTQKDEQSGRFTDAATG